MQNYVERNGEILPSYTGPNAPSYPSRAQRDEEIPHDRYDLLEAPNDDEMISRQVGFTALEAAKQDLLDKGANPTYTESGQKGSTVVHLADRGHFR